MTAFDFSAAAPVLDPRLAQVLEYWLGSERPSNASALARQSLWFTKSEATDEEIRKRFGAVLLEALAGKLHAQAQHPLGWLALLIVLDQFTRNAYRGTAKAFAGDVQALALAQQGIDAGNQFARGKRFGHITVGTEVQPLFLIGFFGTRGEQNNRQLAGALVAAQLFGKLYARYARQHPVEQQ